MATITYNVTGMSCQHCVNAITEEVTKVDDVDTVVVDLDNGTVSVTGAELDDASRGSDRRGRLRGCRNLTLGPAIGVGHSVADGLGAPDFMSATISDTFAQIFCTSGECISLRWLTLPRMMSSSSNSG